jgi:repressor LexA
MSKKIIGYDYAEEKTVASDKCFFLKVKGNDMAPKFEDGDLVLVRLQFSVDSGKYIVAVVNDATIIRQIFYGDDWVELKSCNPNCPTMRFEGEAAKLIYVVGQIIESKIIIT